MVGVPVPVPVSVVVEDGAVVVGDRALLEVVSVEVGTVDSAVVVEGLDVLLLVMDVDEAEPGTHCS